MVISHTKKRYATPISANELRLNIKLRSERGEPASAAAMSLSLDHMPHA